MNAPQLPLALRFPADQRLDGFVGSTAELAQISATARGQRRDWLYLSGAAGCGKSHLLMAACTEASGQDRRPAYLCLAAVPGRLAQVLTGHESADLVCLDDLDSIAGQREDEIALFDFHNRARSAGTTLIYAARGSAAQLGLTLPDLGSRLAQCAQMPLLALDDRGRRQVLEIRGRHRGLELDATVLDYLFSRVGRDLATLTALLDRLDRESLAAQRRITVPFVRSLLRTEVS